MHAIAKALLEREILDGQEIDLLMQGKFLKPIRKPSSSRRRKPWVKSDSKGTAKRTATRKTTDARKSSPTTPDKAKPPVRKKSNQTSSQRKTTEKNVPEKTNTSKSETAAKRGKSVTIRIKPEENKIAGSKSKTKSSKVPKVISNSFNVNDTDYPKTVREVKKADAETKKSNFETANEKISNNFKVVTEESSKDILKSISEETALSAKRQQSIKTVNGDKLELQLDVSNVNDDKPSASEASKKTSTSGPVRKTKSRTSSYTRRAAALKRADSKSKPTVSEGTEEPESKHDNQIKSGKSSKE